MLNSERFVDAAAATVCATLLDEGRYMCSESSMYRVLREHGEVGERRRQATHPPKVKPEVVATGATSAGHGTSPSCSARASGPITTCT